MAREARMWLVIGQGQGWWRIHMHMHTCTDTHTQGLSLCLPVVKVLRRRMELMVPCYCGSVCVCRCVCLMLMMLLVMMMAEMQIFECVSCPLLLLPCWLVAIWFLHGAREGRTRRHLCMCMYLCCVGGMYVVVWLCVHVTKRKRSPMGSSYERCMRDSNRHDDPCGPASSSCKFIHIMPNSHFDCIIGACPSFIVPLNALPVQS